MVWGVFAVVTTLILTTFQHYGVTWDEELQSQYGLAVLDYYVSGFHDDRYREIFNLYLYGGMFDGLAALVDRITPFSIYDTRHLLNASFGLLALWGTWRVGRFVGGGLVGLLAVILLITTPMFYGHMFNNPKDIPFAAGIMWSIYYMGRIGSRDQGLQNKKYQVLKLAIILGLTLGVRVGGIMVMAFWMVPVGWAALRKIRRRNFASALRIILRDEVRIVLPVVALSYLVMLVCWPWAQLNPVMNPLRALSEFSNFPQDVEVLLGGTIYRSTQLPWYYVPLYFGVQLPELLLVLLAASYALVPRMWKTMRVAQKEILTLVTLMAYAPIVFAVLHHSALYDAVRHFLFAVPLFCVLAALTVKYGSAWAIGEFGQRWAKRSIAAGLMLVFIIGFSSQIAIMVRLHPYEYIFVNQFTGGVPGGYGKFEMDYWGSSFKEAAAKLQDFVTNEGGVPPGKIYRIAICGPWDSAMLYLPPDYEPVDANASAEFFLSTTRWMCQNMRPGKEIVRVDRMGVPLSIIKDLR